MEYVSYMYLRKGNHATKQPINVYVSILLHKGAIATDINKETLDDLQKKKQEEQVIQIHKIAQPEEVVKVALFLVSSSASNVTDTTVYADGGLTLSS